MGAGFAEAASLGAGVFRVAAPGAAPGAGGAPTLASLMAGAAAAGRAVAACLGLVLVCFLFLSAVEAFAAVVDFLGSCEAAVAFGGSCFWGAEAFGGFGAEGALGAPTAESLIGGCVGALEAVFSDSCFTGSCFGGAGFFSAEVFSSEGLEAADGSEFADGLEDTEAPEDAPDSGCFCWSGDDFAEPVRALRTARSSPKICFTLHLPKARSSALIHQY